MTNQNNEIVSIFPFIRNGNVCIIHSLENSHNAFNKLNISLEELLHAFSKEIIRQSQNREGEKGIKAILITDLKNTFFYKYPSIQHKILHYITGKRELGSDLENPDTKEFIFSCINEFEEKQIHLGKVEASYSPTDTIIIDMRQKKIGEEEKEKE